MNRFEQKLENRLEDLTQTADAAGESRLPRNVQRSARTRGRGKITAFALGIATAAGLALGLNGLGIIGDTDRSTDVDTGQRDAD